MTNKQLIMDVTLTALSSTCLSYMSLGGMTTKPLWGPPSQDEPEQVVESSHGTRSATVTDGPQWPSVMLAV